MDHPRFVIVGGGLAGALTACYLGKTGYEVDVYEMRDDLRVSEVGGGRSINLALSYRGLCALEPVGLTEEVLRQAVPMRDPQDLEIFPAGCSRTRALIINNLRPVRWPGQVTGFILKRKNWSWLDKNAMINRQLSSWPASIRKPI